MKDKSKPRTIPVVIRMTPAELAAAERAEKKISSVKLSRSVLLRELIRLGVRAALREKQK